MDDEKRSKLRDLLRTAPKPQLHLHLDGSLSCKFIKQCIERMKKSHPERVSNLFMPNDWTLESQNDLYDWLMDMKSIQIKGGSVMNKNSNWKIFDFCNQFLQTKDDLYLATYELVMTLYEEHCVNYIEIRFAPVLHTLLNLSQVEVVHAVQDGFKNAKKDLAVRGFTLQGGIILCALRSYPIIHAEETLALARKIETVLGFDIAGDEGTYPLFLFENVLKSAKTSGIKTTVHAGEWNERNNPIILDNLKIALNTGVDRVGHGLALRSICEETLNKFKDAKIAVEICLTANCGNPDKCKSFAEHPITLMLENNINVAGLNCDNILLSGSKLVGAPNPTNECVRALLDCKITPLNLLKVIENGYNAGFHESSFSIGEEAVNLWKEHYIPKIMELI